MIEIERVNLYNRVIQNFTKNPNSHLFFKEPQLLQHIAIKKKKDNIYLKKKRVLKTTGNNKKFVQAYAFNNNAK